MRTYAHYSIVFWVMVREVVSQVALARVTVVFHEGQV